MDLKPSNTRPAAGTPARVSGRSRTIGAVLLALAMIISGLFTVAGPVEAAEPGAYVLYDDAISNGFGDWSWASVDTDHRQTVHSGAAAVSVDAGPWEAFYMGRSDDQPLPLHGSLRFELHGGSSIGDIGVVVVSSAGDSQPIPIRPTAGAWSSHEIDLADLGGFSSFSGLWFANLSASDRPTFYVDEVRIVTGNAPAPTGGPNLLVDLGSRSLTRTVTDPAAGIATDHVTTFPHPISDGIYGMNFVTNGVREELDITINRWGGNSTERFNHEIATTNIGNDWFFMNSPDDLGVDHRFESDNEADGTDTILTLPMLGWVAKNREANCGYPTVDILGPEYNAGRQDAEEPHWLNQALLCGNGFVDGQRIYSGRDGGVDGVDQTVTSVAVDETFAASWVADLVATHGDAQAGGVEMYALGNEPGLWNSTHADVRPEPIGRAELIDRNQTWASAVKAVDPTADVIGPVLWSGFSYYVTSEEFENGQRPGDVPTFVADYLDAMRAAGEAAGTRMLDSLAVNFYDDRVYQGGSDELRLESTRQLWDPTYAPADWWVSRDFLYGDGSAVIPRLNSLIGQHYPGTGLAITEYNFGGSNTLVGALAQADVLGIFGREGLDIATIWDPYGDWIGLTEEQYAARPLIDAFRLYRNYDGQGSKFGDISNFARSSNEAEVAVHAASRSSDGAITVLIINKSRSDFESPLAIAGMANGTGNFNGTAERYDYSAATNGSIVRGADVAITNSQSTVSLPARSASLLIIPGGGTSPEPEPEPEPQPEPEPMIVYPSLSDGVAVVDQPASTVEGGSLDNADTISVWLESGPITLDEELTVNRVASGRFRGTFNARASIPAETTVCSWFVHADILQDRGRLTGSLSFDGAQVLGIVTKRRELQGSDRLGADATSYIYGGSESNDLFELNRAAGRTELSVNFATGRGTDNARIITNCEN